MLATGLKWIAAAWLLLALGCTAPSLKLALEAQARADQVQRFVFERQQKAVRLLLYRDLVHRLEQESSLSEQQQATLNDVWNDRDLAAFWAVQFERAAALRVAGVDAKLAADQAIPELLYKSWRRRERAAVSALAGELGEAWGRGVSARGGSATGEQEVEDGR